MHDQLERAPATLPGRAARAGARRRSRSASRARRRSGPPGEPRRVGYLYILPAFLVYVAFVLAPFAHGAWISLFEWDGVTPGRWVGLANYTDAIADATVRSAFVHSLVLIVFYSALPIALGLTLAAALSRTQIRGFAGFQTVLFLPQIVATVVIAVTWRWIYGPEGPLNELLRSVGLDSLARAWLGDFTWALPSVGLVGTWVMYGLCMVLFLAGIQRIPTTLYEAARIDGAGPFREVTAVTVPGLRNELAVVVALTVIAALRTFDLIFVTTKGGPGDETTVPSVLIYRRAFETGQVGSAAAVAVMLTVVVLALTFVLTRVAEGSRT